MKIEDVIARLEAFHVLPDHPERTVDTVKCGDVSQECTGIAVTVCASVEVIRSAAAQGCNLLIVHEPTFYGDAEGAPSLGNDPVYLEKRALLERSGVVIYRDHDRMHGPGGPAAKVHTATDCIYYGIMKELGWERWREGEETKPLWFRIPRTTVRALAAELIDAFGLTGARIVGDPEAGVETVFLCEHVWGRQNDYEIIASAAEADVMIPLEIMDWTLTAYVRDAAQLGRGKAIIEMGHFNTEELGMRYFARLLPDILGNVVPVRFIQSGDVYDYIVRG